MLKNEAIIRADAVRILTGMIEAVKTDDEAQYLHNLAKLEVYEDVLCLNRYGRSVQEKCLKNAKEELL